MKQHENINNLNKVNEYHSRFRLNKPQRDFFKGVKTVRSWCETVDGKRRIIIEEMEGK